MNKPFTSPCGFMFERKTKTTINVTLNSSDKYQLLKLGRLWPEQPKKLLTWLQAQCSDGAIKKSLKKVKFNEQLNTRHVYTVKKTSLSHYASSDMMLYIPRSDEYPERLMLYEKYLYPWLKPYFKDIFNAAPLEFPSHIISVMPDSSGCYTFILALKDLGYSEFLDVIQTPDKIIKLINMSLIKKLEDDHFIQSYQALKTKIMVFKAADDRHITASLNTTGDGVSITFHKNLTEQCFSKKHCALLNDVYEQQQKLSDVQCPIRVKSELTQELTFEISMKPGALDYNAIVFNRSSQKTAFALFAYAQQQLIDNVTGITEASFKQNCLQKYKMPKPSSSRLAAPRPRRAVRFQPDKIGPTVDADVVESPKPSF